MKSSLNGLIRNLFKTIKSKFLILIPKIYGKKEGSLSYFNNFICSLRLIIHKFFFSFLIQTNCYSFDLTFSK